MGSETLPSFWLFFKPPTAESCDGAATRKMAPDDVIPVAKEQWCFGRSYKHATIAKIAKRLKQAA
jgi:hypothetical protein